MHSCDTVAVVAVRRRNRPPGLSVSCLVEAALTWLPFTQIDAIGTKRFDSDKSGDREVQRTMLELLNQLDGFEATKNIKVKIWNRLSWVTYNKSG